MSPTIAKENIFLKKLSRFSKEYAIVGAILVLIIVFSFVSEFFFTFVNIRNLFAQAAPLGLVAIGQAYIILSGDFDLSLGQNVAVTSCLAAWLMRFGGVNPWIAIAIALLTGAIIGASNGILVAYAKIPCFVATLGLQMISRGFARIITNAAPIPGMPEEIHFLGRGFIGGARYGLPVSVAILIAFYIVFIFIAHKTRLGRSIYAIGGSREAAYFAGINVKKYRCIAFIIGGTLAAFGGIILLSRLDSAAVTNGNLYEFETIIACIIGGISLAGGKGKVVQALLGTFFLVLFFNGMTMLNVHPFTQDVLRGVVLISAVAIDVIRNQRK